MIVWIKVDPKRVTAIMHARHIGFNADETMLRAKRARYAHAFIKITKLEVGPLQGADGGFCCGIPH